MRVNLDVFWERYPPTIYVSYIHLCKNIFSWNKLGIYHKIALPVFGSFPINEDVCGYGVTINMVLISLNMGIYVGYTQC